MIDLAAGIRWILTHAGRHTPPALTRSVNGALNCLETGRMLHQHHLDPPVRYSDRHRLFDIAITQMRDRRALYLEFGVASGATIRYWARHMTGPHATLHGFDSFIGLPEDWGQVPKGHFSSGGAVPDIGDSRVTLFPGWFSDVLPKYQPPSHDVAFFNIDSDLYSSAATVLAWARPLLAVGDFLYFDEFRDRLNEGRAFAEFLHDTGYRFITLGATRDLGQILFQRRA